MPVGLLLGSEDRRAKKNRGYRKKKTSMGEVAHSFQRIAAIRIQTFFSPRKPFSKKNMSMPRNTQCLRVLFLNGDCKIEMNHFSHVMQPRYCLVAEFQVFHIDAVDIVISRNSDFTP